MGGTEKKAVLQQAGGTILGYYVPEKILPGQHFAAEKNGDAIIIKIEGSRTEKLEESTSNSDVTL